MPEAVSYISDAFNAVLDKYTLADLMLSPKDFGLQPAA